MVQTLAYRLTGSPDVYQHEEREPEQSINFIACHDGFTLNDLVSYNHKHNEANNEANRDGCDSNFSWNCGIEGPTDDMAVEQLRDRQIKNFLALNLLAVGTPMLLMGDEVRRTQLGNNNAYCQNNEISWFDWALLDKHAPIHRFTKQLIALRLNRNLPIERLGITLNELLRQQRVEWHGVKLNSPDWGQESHTLAATVHLLSEQFILHLMINAYWEALLFELPPLPTNHRWHCMIDTAKPSPDDFCPPDTAPMIAESEYLVAARSIVLFISRPL